MAHQWHHGPISIFLLVLWTIWSIFYPLFLQVVKLVEALRKESNITKTDPGKAYDEMLDPDKAEIKQNNQVNQNQESGAVGGVAFDEESMSQFAPCRDKNVNLTSNGKHARLKEFLFSKP